MDDKDIKIVREHYIGRVLNNEIPEYKVLDWESREAQQKRFSTLLKNFDINNSSLLDVGCGLCHLAEYIESKNILNVEYTAVDIIPEMIKRAKEKTFNNIKPIFIVGDIFNDKQLLGNKKFDYVYSSGIFNLNTGNNISFLNMAIKEFVDLANKGVCFNLLDISSNYGERYYYYSKNDVIESVKNILGSRLYTLDIASDYLSNDFSVIIKL